MKELKYPKFKKNPKLQILFLIILTFLILLSCKSTRVGTTEIGVQTTVDPQLSGSNLQDSKNNSSNNNPGFEQSGIENSIKDGLGTPTAVVSNNLTEGNPASTSQVTSNLPPEKAEIGFMAPSFNLPSIDGEQIDLSQFRGRNLILNYWTSWCIPCQEELPMLERFHKEYPIEDLTILTVNGTAQDSVADAQETINKFGLTFPVILDDNDVFKKAYLAEFLPTSYFIDSTGIIRYILRGTTSEEKFRELIGDLLSGTFIIQ